MSLECNGNLRGERKKEADLSAEICSGVTLQQAVFKQ